MNCLRRILVLALLLAFAGTAVSQPTKIDDLRNGPKVLKAFREVVAKPSAHTVRVLADGKEVALGTIVEADGWILTKWSEIEAKSDKVTVRLKDGKVLKAEVRGVKDDKVGAYDIAMLKVDAKGLPTVQWRPSKDATVGKWVASVGTGADPVAIGVVSVATRKYKAGDQGPKIDNFRAGYLGVANLTEAMGGAKVGSFPKPSPAEKAGLKVDDIIYEIAGRRIVDTESLINIVGRFKPGDKVLVKVKRGEEEKEFDVTLGTRPKELQGNPQERMGTRLSTRRGGFPAIIQHDSGIRPEDCGGPLVDLDGKTVGINIARAGRTESYAIPSEDIQPLLSELKSGKLAPKDDPLTEATPQSKNTNVILRKVSNLSDKDKFDQKRPNMAPNRYMKVEEVNLSAGVTYIIEMDSAEIDSYLIVEDVKGKKLAEDDDSGIDLNAKIVFRAPSDSVYRIIATTFNPRETGNYTLTVRRQADPQKAKPMK
jgi:serine protease Do